MLNVVGDYLDVMGTDDEGVYTVGAPPRGMMAARPAGARIARLPSPLANASPQGVSLPKEELDFLPFNAVTLSGETSGGDPAVLSGELYTFPQRPFRGERLVINAVYTDGQGASSDGLFRIAINPAIFVGAVQVGATQGKTPASVFAATAFGVRLSMPVAGQGTRISFNVETPQLATDSTLYVSATLIGRAVR